MAKAVADHTHCSIAVLGCYILKMMNTHLGAYDRNRLLFVLLNVIHPVFESTGSLAKWDGPNMAH